ncbi:hydroxymethylbilane synthase [Leucobacter sp. UT-8R-CII-1-4]|uniref:hydroxymethylbilane synthase n=1 Tax=Leucobacter sp. UT-8R-CII-1-4 TaxID=3040075 RepID=UPI0024A92C95|nr:hydroxymethylbilane synthase [Leucobacter sp. UT-8R-CII-1-4]MDI6022507.1 hydroxymethylbilane synthase [Leucobacter sp. UT-8R-CII-1-4]
MKSAHSAPIAHSSATPAPLPEGHPAAGRPNAGKVTRPSGEVSAEPGLIRIGTRGSALAVSQTTTVAEQIALATGYEVALVIITTHGDVSRAPLAQLGGTGVFVSALRDALLGGECDLAVHSLKDLPTGPCEGISLGAVPVRADPRDALCSRDGFTLETLPVAAKVGTGSPRRAAQLLARRPDLQVSDLRGNVDTRLGRVGNDLDAVVLAAAGLDRIGRADAIAERFELSDAPPAPGQGALAIEVRSADVAAEPFRTALAALDEAKARAEALAERFLLGTLEAGCAAPIGATASLTDGVLTLSASVYRLDGSEQLTASASLSFDAAAPDAEIPAELGRIVAAALLERGAEELAPLRGTR